MILFRTHFDFDTRRSTFNKKAGLKKGYKHIQNKMELIQNNLEPWQVEWLRPLEQLESNHNLATTLISTLIRTSLLKSYLTSKSSQL
jgi:hypothetical protein